MDGECVRSRPASDRFPNCPSGGSYYKVELSKSDSRSEKREQPRLKWNGHGYFNGTCASERIEIGWRLGGLAFDGSPAMWGRDRIFRIIDFHCQIVQVSIRCTVQSAATSHVRCSGYDKSKWTRKVVERWLTTEVGPMRETRVLVKEPPLTSFPTPSLLSRRLLLYKGLGGHTLSRGVKNTKSFVQPSAKLMPREALLQKSSACNIASTDKAPKLTPPHERCD